MVHGGSEMSGGIRWDRRPVDPTGLAGRMGGWVGCIKDARDDRGARMGGEVDEATFYRNFESLDKML